VRPLLEETIAAIRAELPPGRGSCTVAFAEEVVRQIAYPLGGAPAPDREAGERGATREVLALVRAAFDGGTVCAAASRRLADDAVMLAVFFQNLDLLGDCPRGHGGAVAALVAAALDTSAAPDR
jgi:hypothetical protein